MKIIVVAILATIALLLGVIWDNVAAPKYVTLLTAAVISEFVALVGFVYLIKVSRGFMKYYSSVCVIICLLIMADAIGRLLAGPITIGG